MIHQEKEWLGYFCIVGCGWFAVVLLVLGSGNLGWGQSLQPAKKSPASTKAEKKSKSYEDLLIEAALQRTGLTREFHPEGKIIERIVIVRESMVASIDPWPRWLNWIHITSRDSVIRQELLLQTGERWEENKIEESARNLRSLSILATVRSVACRSKKLGHVVWLVVTKDVWSLKISTDFELIGTVFRTLGLFPVETNFLGRNKQLGMEFSVSQFDLSNFSVHDQWIVGQYYYDLRLAGTRLRLLEWFRLFLDGASPCGGAIGSQKDVWCPLSTPGSVRGFYGQISLDRPLYSLSSTWAFALGAEILWNQGRVFRQNPLEQEPPLGERKGVSLATVQFEHPDGELRAVPRVYERFLLSLYGSYTRSFGYRVKHDVSVGAGIYRFQYDPPANFPFDEWIRRAFVQQVLPRSESAAYVSLTYRLRPTVFRQLRNINRYATTEDFSLGGEMSTRISAAVDLNVPSQQFLTFSASLFYRWLWGQNMFSVATDGSARWQPRSNEVGLRGPWSNLQWSGTIRNVSPPLWIGRIHAQILVLLRTLSIDRNFSSLGSEQGLRGYLSGQFLGENMFRVNVEYRTLPLNLWTFHVGLVVFYDGGGLWGGSDPNRPNETLPFLYRQSVGLGLRGLFPQFSKSVMRLDVGFPLTENPGSFLNWISLSFEQAF